MEILRGIDPRIKIVGLGLAAVLLSSTNLSSDVTNKTGQSLDQECKPIPTPTIGGIGAQSASSFETDSGCDTKNKIDLRKLIPLPIQELLPFTEIIPLAPHATDTLLPQTS